MTRNQVLQDLLARVPIVQTLGMRCDVKGDDMTAILPFNNKLIGNFSLKALHGGCDINAENVIRRDLRRLH